LKRHSTILTIEDETISGLETKDPKSLAQEYQRCTFQRCDFSNANLSGKSFTECEFVGCNLTLANISGASFSSVTFTECKLTGLRFDQCNYFLFTIRCEGCLLDRASFYKVKAKKTEFIKCSMKETDLTECDLSGSLFDLCDLERAVFDRTNLEKADLRTAYHYSIDPAINRIAKAKFSTSGIAGLLDKYDIVIE
jgi:fluoroquinolone resistance protein